MNKKAQLTQRSARDSAGIVAPPGESEYNTQHRLRTKFRENSNVQQFKVIQGRWFWYRSKAHIRLPTSNIGPILHRFRDTAIYWLKIAYFSYPCVIRRPRSLSSLWNFTVKLGVRKLESWGCGKGCVILTSTVFDWSTRVTDRQTDGRAMA